MDRNTDLLTPNSEGVDFKKKSVSWSGNTSNFFFDSEGHMVTGWIESKGKMYYANEYGYLLTGWQELEPDDNMMNGDYEDVEHFNFKPSGELRRASELGVKAVEGDNTITWYDGKQYHVFNQDGVLVSDWYKVALVSPDTDIYGEGEEATLSTAATAKNEAVGFAGDYPVTGTGWVYGLDQKEDDYHWYYLVTYKEEDGKLRKNIPFNSLASDGLSRAKKIGGKTYLFNNMGEMQTGLIEVQVKDDADTNLVNAGLKEVRTVPAAPSGDYGGGVKSNFLASGIYFFRKDGATTAGQMTTGGRTAITDDDETNYYYFGKDGRALINTVKDGTVYGPDGKRVQADDGNSNMIKPVEETLKDSKGNDMVEEGSEIIVTSSGKLRTQNSVVRIEGERYKVKVEGIKWSLVPQD